jgi:indole-3-glycerol phosphate synthase
VTILTEILAHKRDEVARARSVRPPEDVAAQARLAPAAARRFREAVRDGPAPRIVAEIKRRSPSRGEIRPGFDAVGCAKAYADAGAAAISVLTDERYFGGSLDDLAAVRREVSLPLLRKDFVVDAYQLDEARAAGADAVLLIVAAFEPSGHIRALAELRARATEIGLDALVEVHDESELEAALAAGADLVGINNRDLRTFEVDLAVTERLAARVPAGVAVVAESGIFTNRDVRRLEAAGAHAFLVGEALMRQADVGLALGELRRGP